MENKRLTIRNYGKIWGKTYYEDGTWDTLHPSHIKSGARAKVQYMKENDNNYVLTILFIQPQPETATITIERDSTEVVGTSMYRVEVERRNILISDELWESNQFTMDKVLMSIKSWLLK